MERKKGVWQLYWQNGNLAQRSASWSDAKSIMFVFVPTAVCYLIFRQSLTLLSDLWAVGSRDPEQIYHVHACIPALVWLYYMHFPGYAAFAACPRCYLIMSKGRDPVQKKLQIKDGGMRSLCISFSHTESCNISCQRWQRSRSMAQANIETG